jgi:hypothetical protein
METYLGRRTLCRAGVQGTQGGHEKEEDEDCSEPKRLRPRSDDLHFNNGDLANVPYVLNLLYLDCVVCIYLGEACTRFLWSSSSLSGVGHRTLLIHREEEF